jgi:hypothetical protein
MQISSQIYEKMLNCDKDYLLACYGLRIFDFRPIRGEICKRVLAWTKELYLFGVVKQFCRF